MTTPTTGCDTQCNKNPYHTFQSNNGVLAISESKLIAPFGSQTFNIPLNAVIIGMMQSQFSANVLDNTKPNALSQFKGMFMNTIGTPSPASEITFIDDSNNFQVAKYNYIEYDLKNIANNTPDKIATISQSMQLVNQYGFLPCSIFKDNAINNNTQDQTRAIQLQNATGLQNIFCNVVYLDYTWLYR